MTQHTIANSTWSFSSAQDWRLDYVNVGAPGSESLASPPTSDWRSGSFWGHWDADYFLYRTGTGSGSGTWYTYLTWGSGYLVSPAGYAGATAVTFTACSGEWGKN